LLNKETTVNQDSAETEKETNLFDERTLMDKGQLVIMNIVKSDQDRIRLKLIGSCNLEREDMKFVNIYYAHFGYDNLVEQEENSLLKVNRKRLEAIIYLLFGIVLMFVSKLIRLKFVEFILDQNLKGFSHHSVIKDPGRISEIVSLDGECFSPWKVKNWMRKVWSLKHKLFEYRKLLRIDLIMQKQEL
jgi:hypothetical protein